MRLFMYTAGYYPDEREPVLVFAADEESALSALRVRMAISRHVEEPRATDLVEVPIPTSGVHIEMPWGGTC